MCFMCVTSWYILTDVNYRQGRICSLRKLLKYTNTHTHVAVTLKYTASGWRRLPTGNQHQLHHTLYNWRHDCAYIILIDTNIVERLHCHGHYSSFTSHTTTTTHIIENVKNFHKPHTHTQRFLSAEKASASRESEWEKMCGHLLETP